MAEGSRRTTNLLLAVIAALLVLLVLHFLGVIGPSKEEAEFRIETPDGGASIDVD